MNRLLAILAVFVAGLLHAEPIILSSDNIGDNYYDSAPADLLGEKNWLGLFITGAESPENRGQSHLVVTRVTFVPRRESGRMIYRMVTTPPNAVLLISQVPNVSAGAATTAGRFVDLWEDKREAEFRVGERVYRIRLESRQPDHCDGVITLTSDAHTQKLFDATEPDATTDPDLDLACDEPHFKIHWAGDLDHDGRLDMLVTFSRKYSYHPNQLLLSSAARPQDLITEVARYERFAQ